jgi:hypothetical protein
MAKTKLPTKALSSESKEEALAKKKYDCSKAQRHAKHK